jgi:purine-binding chemotaxis protein CheW
MPEIENIQSVGAVGDQSSGEGQLVVFRLSDEEFGVDINNVKEIVRLPDITPIPRSPAYVAGICNLRGSVLPVIDSRIRFSMDVKEATDHTRLLVVETGGMHTGLIVDNVREVMRITDAHLEAPPAVCRGVDKEFLSGVVKIDEGRRLILTLNLGEVIAIDVGSSRSAGAAAGAGTGANLSHREAAEEEQLVSFKVAGEEYAFDIAKVREILRVTDITEVPNVPEYVRGLFTIRNQLMPILDLRRLLGIPTLVSEHHKTIESGIDRHRSWAESVTHAVESGAHFTGSTDPRKTSFGKWLDQYSTSSIDIETALKTLKRCRGDLFDAARRALELKGTSKETALSILDKEAQPLLKTTVDSLSELKSVIEAHISEDQRVMVVEADTMNIGYLVDCVDEVIRIPKSVIDETPAIASSKRKELRGVAKLNNGERLIMIMDESALVSREASRVLSEIQSGAGSTTRDNSAQAKSLAQQSQAEEQLVTFSINKEEYGVRIMQVQEINRVTDITSVPRAPHFVDGVTNLRGNVIPVINIRELFGLENKDIDDRTRIIIVDIGGAKTGLRVDQVNEVLRLMKQDIEKTPSIVTAGGANRYMDGVCKIDSGKRMVVLLDVERILDEKELKFLSEIAQESESGRQDENEAKALDERKKPGKKKPQVEIRE